MCNQNYFQLTIFLYFLYIWNILAIKCLTWQIWLGVTVMLTTKSVCLVASVVFNSLQPHRLALQAPLSMGFSRQKYWSGLPFPSPGDLPDPGIESRSHVSYTGKCRRHSITSTIWKSAHEYFHYNSHHLVPISWHPPLLIHCTVDHIILHHSWYHLL